MAYIYIHRLMHFSELEKLFVKFNMLNTKFHTLSRAENKRKERQLSTKSLYINLPS